MKINFFVCCENSYVDSSNKLNLIAPIQSIKLINIPSNYSFALSFGLCDLDSAGENKLTLKLVSPTTGVESIVADMVIPTPPKEELIKDGKFCAQFNMDIRNMVFNSYGIHIFKIYENDKILSEFEILVEGDDGIVS